MAASYDAHTNIVHSLMCYRKGGESADFVERCIEVLVKKLETKRVELDSLITAVTSNGNIPTDCVTIPRSLDGRMQLSGRKLWPHVLYTGIWRWPDVHRGELTHVEGCQYSFHLRLDSVCVNPFHYERVVRPITESEAMESSVDMISTDILSWSTPEHSQVSTVNPTSHNVVNWTESSSSTALGPQQQHAIFPFMSQQNHPAIGHSTPGWQSLTYPDYWCSITYFEHDIEVEEYKAPTNCPNITVDGYCDSLAIKRFCLGALTNIHRTEQSETTRPHIAQGIQLELIGEGDVILSCLSNHSVFLESHYLNTVTGRASGGVVHEICPSASVKVFDFQHSYEQMKKVASAKAVELSGHASEESSPSGVDYLRRHLCSVRLSFIKGWGDDYPRKTIKKTPCWIEIHVHRALQLLDHLLRQGRLDELS